MLILQKGQYREQIKGLLGSLPRDTGWRLGWGRSIIRQSPGGRLLVYHGVCRGNPFRFNTLFLSERSFERQLRFFKKHFHLISLDDFFAQRFSKDRYSLCLTFDDGFANNFRYVLPLLEQYGIPAAFFITASRDLGLDILWNDALCLGYRYGPRRIKVAEEFCRKQSDGRYVVESTGQLLAVYAREKGLYAQLAVIDCFDRYKMPRDAEYWLQMSAEEIKRLAESRWVTIGSHSRSHNDLAALDAPELAKDLDHAKRFIENLAGKEVRAIAFPYGSYNQQVIRAALQSGHTQLLATELNDEPGSREATLRQRLTINPFVSPINQAYAAIRGHYR